MQTGENNP